ncbi:MAG TPA: hypothetical protein VKD70_10310 [Candidatus Acidoferrum sp.]|nr:hypothetical protein [Candidatus Acidoferrum sp.]
MRIDTAISLIGMVMEATVHRENCLKSVKRDVPTELLSAALADLEADGADTTETCAWLSRHGVQVPQSAQAFYRRRANNQVSAEIEGLIRDMLNKGWTKTAIAKQLKINRRVVIRVSREFESAQQHSK